MFMCVSMMLPIVAAKNCLVVISSWISKSFQIVCFYHVAYEFESESTLCSCLNVKELLARSRRHIWRLSDCNGTRTHNHLVRKRSKWLSVRLRTKWVWVRVPLQSAFRLFVADCFLSWQFIVSVLLLYEYYSFWLDDPLWSNQISRNHIMKKYNMSWNI